MTLEPGIVCGQCERLNSLEHASCTECGSDLSLTTDEGAEIIGEHDSDLMRMSREIALNHHEKWDGSGYPSGRKGEEIPLAARIIALADVFDALTTARPYKNAWTVSDAVQLIREQAGKHFDPALVELFVGMLPQILAIKSRYEENGG